MIGTIEALGVFLLAILPGFVSLRVLGFRRPPLKAHGAIGELGSTVSVSLAAWILLYLWRGDDLLPVVLSGEGHGTGERTDAFAELLLLALVIGLVVGIAGRIAAELLPRVTGPPAGRAKPGLVGRVKAELRLQSLPRAAWDKLLIRLVNQREAAVCRIRTRSGGEVLGLLATGWVDWEADGRGLFFDKELIRHSDGVLRPVENSQGLFVPGDEISTISVVSVPGSQVTSE